MQPSGQFHRQPGGKGSRQDVWLPRQRRSYRPREPPKPPFTMHLNLPMLLWQSSIWVCCLTGEQPCSYQQSHARYPISYTGRTWDAVITIAEHAPLNRASHHSLADPLLCVIFCK